MKHLKRVLRGLSILVLTIATMIPLIGFAVWVLEHHNLFARVALIVVVVSIASWHIGSKI